VTDDYRCYDTIDICKEKLESNPMSEIRVFHNKMAYAEDQPHSDYWKVVVLTDTGIREHLCSAVIFKGVEIMTLNGGFQHGYPRFHLVTHGDVRIRGRTAFIVPKGSVGYPDTKLPSKAS
jgi:hypothetical protein